MNNKKMSAGGPLRQSSSEASGSPPEADGPLAHAFGGKKDSELSPELYHVAREKGTESPFTGKYWNNHEQGMYRCAVCGDKLFSSDTKFDSGTGWPSFTEPANLENVELKEDSSYGMGRTEVLCKNCGAHLGHVFDDGPKDKGGRRYCINSVCLELEKQNSGGA